MRLSIPQTETITHTGRINLPRGIRAFSTNCIICFESYMNLHAQQAKTNCEIGPINY